ncbi:MAG: glucose 1-dehydrogenase [Lapillicoccus sp.]
MTHPLFDITGRTALVTGSSRGIGRALARGLLEAGATVVLNGRDGERLERTRAELVDETGGTAYALAFDVTDSAAVDRGVAQALDMVGGLDILVNNTGTQHRAPITDFTDADWHRLVATNLTSAFLVSRAVARHMVTRRRGKIVTISSVQSLLARPGIAPYAATKGALTMLTKGLAADLAGSGIQCNALAPGYLATELTAALVDDADFSRWVEQRTPAGRWGEVSDLVGTLLFLCSPASDFVNGQTVYVDGGMTAVL